MAVLALDNRLTELVDPDAEVDQIATGFNFTEGPVWNPMDRSLTFVDITMGDPEGGTIFRWTEAGGAEVFRKPSRNSNGNTLDLQGRLVTCVMGSRQVLRTNDDGSTTALAGRNASTWAALSSS